MQYLVLGDETSTLRLTLYLMLSERRVQQQGTQKQRLSILNFNHSFEKNEYAQTHQLNLTKCCAISCTEQ